jgi:hypothetical protein
MRLTIAPRLRKPAVTALTGILFAVAWLIRGGPLWWVSILALIAGAARAAHLYWIGGQETDEGALAGSHADERQQLVGLRSRALGYNLAVIAAFAGVLAGIAAGATWWWPFLIILAVAGFGHLFGLSTYGSGEPDADEDTAGGADPGPGAGQPARFPAQG